MFPKSLQWRLVLIFILITTSLMIFVGVFLNKSVESLYYDTFKKGIETGFKSWNTVKGWNIKDMSNVSIDDVLTELRDNKDALYFFLIIGDYKSYSIINKDTNEIVYSSDNKYSLDKNKFLLGVLKSNNMLSAMSGEIGDKESLTYTEDATFFDYAEPVKLKEGNFVLYFRYDREEWIGTINSFTRIILTSSIIAFLASLLLGYILSKTITVPIVSIMHKAQEIAAGDFDRVLEVKSDDEIGELTNAFNYMARELKNTLIEISSEKNKSETILNYMTDGVIAFDLSGDVIHANPAAKKMLGVTEIKDTFNSFSQKYGLGTAIEEVLYFESSGNKEKDIKVNDKFIKVYFALFTDEEKKAEGIIAVLHDSTEQQRLENMRKEFVANVSHELRTPLTSIKSYAETLLEGASEDPETTEKFLKVINSEADRMTRLVKDLLQLSRSDNQQMNLKAQNVPFVVLVKCAIEKIQIEAKNKGLVIENYVIGDVPDIKADHDRIEQVVLNILSNAIKYTPAGGKITVYMGKVYSNVYIKVVDTGIGIPQEDLPRIFERFYRVDKARSREMGGTVLGLSIAKEIVEAHGGTIAINSEFGKGTEVMIKLPA